MSIRVKTLSGRPAIAPGPRSTGMVPALSQEAAETRMSRSEKVVSGIAISVLMAGFATGMLGVSAARSFHPRARVAHIQHGADWRNHDRASPTRRPPGQAHSAEL
jgi:hypothetical protein